MTVDFMTTNDDPRKLFKNYSYLKQSVTCKPFEDCGVSDIVLIVDYDASLIDCNTVFVHEFKRLYSVQITTAPGGRLIVSGHVDVLASFSAEIANLSVNVVRSADQVEQYLPDNSIGVTASAETTVIAADDPDHNTFIWGLGTAVSYALGAIGRSSAQT